MNKQEVRNRIEELGIIPSIRLSTPEDALFAASAVARGGIPILEVALTVPEAVQMISHVVQQAPHVIVGAGKCSRRRNRAALSGCGRTVSFQRRP